VFDPYYVLDHAKVPVSMSVMTPRSILIAGRKTSVRLEKAFWVGLQEIADKCLMTLPGLIGTIDEQRQHKNRSSALRLFVLEYYRSQVADAEAKASSGISVPNPPPPPASPPGVPRCGHTLGGLRAPLLEPRGHQPINLTSIVLDAARISGKHKPMLPDLNHAVPDVKARILKLLTRPPFNSVTTPRQRRKKPVRCLRLL
jgi:predicted DNA-binding ribbon-helix-helix protein